MSTWSTFLLRLQALNQTVPTVHDPDPEDRDKRVVNQKETIAAREKQQSLKEKFQEWLWSEQERALRLARLYNDTFNSVVPRRFDGQHLVLPGYSRIVSLHEHQRDAIWRIVASQLNTLLAHVVGAGKTLTCICAGMELRRLGKASKPMYVVPNHMLHQFAAEFLRAYPGANILIASKDDLQGDKRRQLLSRIATGDWDGVLITHASFERIKMSDGFMEEYIQNEIDLIEDAIRAEKQERGNRIIKELARAKKAWEAKLAKMSGKNKKDEILSFEQLGIDWMFVDEAHLFKNLWRFSKMTRVAGLPNSNSERALETPRRSEDRRPEVQGPISACSRHGVVRIRLRRPARSGRQRTAAQAGCEGHRAPRPSDSFQLARGLAETTAPRLEGPLLRDTGRFRCRKTFRQYGFFAVHTDQHGRPCRACANERFLSAQSRKEIRVRAGTGHHRQRATRLGPAILRTDKFGFRSN
jgi:hypothetical protein